MSKQRSTLSKGRNFNAKLVRHCCRFGNKVERCFDIVAKNGNNVEATFDNVAGVDRALNINIHSGDNYSARCSSHATGTLRGLSRGTTRWFCIIATHAFPKVVLTGWLVKVEHVCLSYRYEHYYNGDACLHVGVGSCCLF